MSYNTFFISAVDVEYKMYLHVYDYNDRNRIGKISSPTVL